MVNETLTPKKVKSARGTLAPAVIAAALTIVPSARVMADNYRYDRPLHPLLCDLAIASAQQARRFGAEEECDLPLLAEGLYCRGMRGDAPALAAAIEVLTRIVERDATNVYAQLQLAGALWQRCRDPSRVRRILEDVRQSLGDAALGAVRADLARDIDANIDVVTAASYATVRRPGCGTDHRGTEEAGTGMTLLPPCAR